MNPRVLILSGLYDFSTDSVALLLEKAGVAYVRLNREHLSEYKLTLDPLVPELVIDGPSGTSRIGPDLGAVWFRQPVFLRNTPPDALSVSEQLERSQWTAFIRALSVFNDAAWMNFPASTYLAESKPFQLYTAAQCGFQVPATLAGNDAGRMREKFPGTLIIKSLDTVLLREGDDCLFTYTTLNSNSALNDASVKAAPLLAQHALEEKIDLRVTVVGDKIFAVKILSQGSGIAGDWRTVPKEKLEYRDIEIDAETTDNCLKFARKLGLSFAAIDLLETPDGIFFIEVNPTGEWGWLSTAERPIDRTIAAWLGNPPVSGGRKNEKISD